MTESDIISHLIQVETAASNMISEAQEEVERRITEEKKKADKLYKENFDKLINTLEEEFIEKKHQVDEELAEKLNVYKNNLKSLNQDKRAFNLKLDSYLWEE